MKALRVLGVAALACALLGAAPPRTTSLYGYTVAGSERERRFESMYLDIPSAQGALDAAAIIAARPHYAGSYGDQELAKYMRDKLREYGLETELETLTARVDTPKRLALQLLSSSTNLAATGGQVFEPPPATAPVPKGAGPARATPPTPLPRGRSAPAPRGRGPAAVNLDLRELGAAPEGSSGPIGLPFNAGSPDGNVVGPLVYAAAGREADYDDLARHDVDVRGAIVLVRYGAEFRGGLAARAQRRGAIGVIFYNDPADDGFARGPVAPIGPFRPAGSVERGTVGEGIGIPTLPISATNAQILLGSLRGPTGPRQSGPRAWGGALDVAYPYARGPGVVHLTVQLNRRNTTLWNTIGKIRGTRGAQSVVLGAHRDAWVYGVGDNGSGVITMLEVARGFGYLLQNGWRPLRTIVIAGWDGEEIGSAGSIAYVKRHRDELLNGAVAYLNADETVVGPRFEADGAAAIVQAISDAAREVSDPANPSRSIYEQWAFEKRLSTPVADAPGGGSDHASFLFDVGTPTANMAFTGPLGGYHSAADTLEFATTVSDPGFVRHRAAAQLYGLLAMRLANAEAIPYAFAAYVPLMRNAVTQLGARATAARVPLDLTGLQATIDAFGATATRFDALTARANNTEAAERALEAARILDLAAYSVEGYASSLFPELNRALTSGNAGAAGVALTRTRGAIDRAGDLLAGAAGMAVPVVPAPSPSIRPGTRPQQRATPRPAPRT